MAKSPKPITEKRRHIIYKLKDLFKFNQEELIDIILDLRHENTMIKKIHKKMIKELKAQGSVGEKWQK